MDRASPFTIDYRREVRAGLRDIAPIVVAAVPISLLFGAVAAAKGLSPLEVTVMSALVFAGGAQFAAIETWIHPAPILTLAFATLLINARHVLMGASLSPKVRMSRIQKFLAFFFLTDEAWALSERRAMDRPVTGAYWAVMGIVLWANWTLFSGLGAFLGSFLGDPERHRRGFRLHGPVHRPRRRLRPQPRDAGHGRRQRRRRGPRPPLHRRALACGVGRSRRHRRRLPRRSSGGALMSLDTTTLLAILAMAVVTYFTRIAGLFVADRLVLTGRAKAAFDAIPPAVLVAVIAPTALTTGWAEAIAARESRPSPHFRLPLLAHD